ncbi:MAG TPA: response regulator, partial [Gemmatimonadaceae bacterium]
MSNTAATVTIVDDDDSVRRALARLLTATGYSVRTFASAPDLLTQPARETPSPGCLLVDVRMPEISGFELHAILNRN